MAKCPLVSVVMTVFEPHPVYFPAAVQSVLQQTHQELELVIVEDPSSRPAADLLRTFSDARIRHHCNAVSTLQHAQRNLCLSRNLCLDLAQADIVAVLDADDICHPRRIERQVAMLQRHDDLAVLGSQLEIIDVTGANRGWRYYPLQHGAIVGAMRRFNPIAHPSVMARKQVLLDAGGYACVDCEDYDLWSRLANRGVTFANHPEPLVQYRIHPDGSKATRLDRYIQGTLKVKNRYWINDMDWRGKLRMRLERALLFLPPPLVLQLFTWTQYRSRKPSDRLPL